MTTVVARAPETAAVLALLASVGLRVGDGARPTGWLPADFAAGGYPVLYPLTTTASGTSADAYADVESEYQITSVGSTRAQAQFVADASRTVMLTGALSIPGRALLQPVEWAPSRGVTRDDDVDPPLFTVVDRYVIRTTPV